MRCPEKLKAFTLAELLVVLAIMGLLMSLGGGFSKQVGNTFTAQQYTKKYIQQARILRRKSMLITRNSADEKWVHGIGLQFIQDGTTNKWDMKQIKALDTTGTSRFYKPFPTIVNESSLEIDELETTLDYKLPEGYSINIKEFIDDDTTEDISGTCHRITILYESINGKMHAYCSRLTGDVFETPIGGEIIPNSANDKPEIQIAIGYENGEEYPNKIILKSNGEIHTTN